MLPVVATALVAISANDTQSFRVAIDVYRIKQMPTKTAADRRAILERYKQSRAATQQAFDDIKRRGEELDKQLEEIDKKIEDAKKKKDQIQ